MTTVEQLGTATHPAGAQRTGTPVVSVVATTPETVLADVERAMRWPARSRCCRRSTRRC